MTTFTKTATPVVPEAGKVNLFFNLAGLPAYVGADGQPVRVYNKAEVDALVAAVQADADDKLPIANPAIAADDGFYFGVVDTVGSWRIIRSDDDLVIQRLETVEETDTWVTKSTIAAAGA
jgi:hypothetical protein